MLKYPVRPVNFGCRRPQSGIDDRHLLRVNAQPGAQPTAPAALGICLHLRQVTRARRHAVHRRRQTCPARRHHQRQANRLQFRLVRAARHAQIRLKVEVAEQQPGDLWAAGNVVDGDQPGRRFDYRQQRAGLANGSGQMRQLVGRLGLGQHHASQSQVRQLANQRQIIGVPGGARRVDADHYAGAISQRQMGKSLFKLCACGRFLVRPDGIFQVDDDRARAGGQRLGIAFGPVGGYEQERARQCEGGGRVR